MTKKKPLVITGPTASGKSSYALDIARKQKGVIINADSMQIYKGLPILTAQPSRLVQDDVPHVLYGVREDNNPCSVASWIELAMTEIENAYGKGLRPILVGGTGLYLKSLISGLSKIPEIDSNVRQDARALYKSIGAEEFYKRLKEIDTKIAETLNVNDKQRVIRAYEVKKSTGKSLLEWQESVNRGQGLECDIIVIMRPRKILHQRASERFDEMLALGALEEVKELINKDYAPDLPIMKALGVQELKSNLLGNVTIEEARERAIISTRQYIKRQITWVKHQFPQAQIIELE